MSNIDNSHEDLRNFSQNSSLNQMSQASAGHVHNHMPMNPHLQSGNYGTIVGQLQTNTPNHYQPQNVHMYNSQGGEYMGQNSFMQRPNMATVQSHVMRNVRHQNVRHAMSHDQFRAQQMHQLGNARMHQHVVNNVGNIQPQMHHLHHQQNSQHIGMQSMQHNVNSSQSMQLNGSNPQQVVNNLSTREIVKSSFDEPGQKPTNVSAKQKDVASTLERRILDKSISNSVRSLVPEIEAFEKLLSYEKKLDVKINHKRFDIHQGCKDKTLTRKKQTLRISISTEYTPVTKINPDNPAANVGTWEMRIEGKVVERDSERSTKGKFSTFFNSLVIELDKNQYGPDHHLVEWHNKINQAETDGFQVKRYGDQDVPFTVILSLNYDPPRFQVEPRLSKLIGVCVDTMPNIINSLWRYIKTNKLQDPVERTFINLDRYLQKIFEVPRFEFFEIPHFLRAHLMQPGNIYLNHVLKMNAKEPIKVFHHDISIEEDSDMKESMQKFMTITHENKQLDDLDNEVYDILGKINDMTNSWQFYKSFAENPQGFMFNWIQSQAYDIKVANENVGAPENERRSKFYKKPWVHEAVSRYIYSQVQLKKMELDNVLSNRTN